MRRLDMRLYLPKTWIDDPARCEQAGIPLKAGTLTSKSEHALDLLRQARARVMRFAWVGVVWQGTRLPAGAGRQRGIRRRCPSHPTDLDRTARTCGFAGPTRSRPSGAQAEGLGGSGHGGKLVQGFGSGDWTRCVLRDSTRRQLRVDLAHRRVWVWDGEEETPRCWHPIVRREAQSEKTIKYTLSNAPADTPLLDLGQMQGHRYWVERTFEDAKGECGLADYRPSAGDLGTTTSRW
jgi:hypothetical protein